MVPAPGGGAVNFPPSPMSIKALSADTHIDVSVTVRGMQIRRGCGSRRDGGPAGGVQGVAISASVVGLGAIPCLLAGRGVLVCEPDGASRDFRACGERTRSGTAYAEQFGCLVARMPEPGTIDLLP